MQQSNRHEQLLQKGIEQAEFFFTSLRSGENEGKPCFFRLSSVKNVQASAKGGSSFHVNYVDAEMSDSLINLENALKMHGPTQMQYIVITLVTSKNSNNDNQTKIENPYYTGGLMHMQPSGQSPSVAGFGGYGNYYQQMPQHPNVYDMQRQHFESMQQLQLQIEQLKHERALEQKEATIAALEEGNIGRLEKMAGMAIDFIQSDAGKPVINAVVARIMGTAPPAPAQVPPPAPAPPQHGHPQTDNNPPPQQPMQPQLNEDGKMIQQSLLSIGETFPDLPQAMNDLALLIKSNPMMAQTIRQQAQTIRQEQQTL
jgi:hypothetical protein